MLALWRDAHYSCSEWRRLLAIEYFGKPRELLKMSVPSLVYAVQNNLDFVALANLDPGVYQVAQVRPTATLFCR
jgi:UDP-sugar transporter A1/2/3